MHFSIKVWVNNFALSFNAGKFRRSSIRLLRKRFGLVQPVSIRTNLALYDVPQRQGCHCLLQISRMLFVQPSQRFRVAKSNYFL